jgi:D-alanyl-D-alanine carboxypeptidase
VSGASYESFVHEQIFDRLEMQRSFFPGRTSPREGTTAIRPAHIHGADLSSSPSLTGDWAGGGVASTDGDLLRFSEALFGGQLVSPATLELFQSFEHVYRKGIHYGHGLMQYRFGEFLFLLQSYPKMIGHMGVLGTQLFYDRERDLHVVCSLGTDTGTANSVRLIITAIGLAMRVQGAA